MNINHLYNLSKLTLLISTLFLIWEWNSLGVKTFITCFLFFFIVNHYHFKQKKKKENTYNKSREKQRIAELEADVRRIKLNDN